MHITVWFKAVYIDAANRFHLKIYDVKSYNDITSATNCVCRECTLYRHIDCEKMFAV